MRGLALVNYGRSFATGSAFAVGWTPCIGPVLASILTLAASSSTVFGGSLLLLAWSLGLGVPFVLAGLALGRAMRAIHGLRPIMPVLEVAGGVLVIVVGILIFTDRFTIFNQYLTFGVSAVTSSEETLSGSGVSGPTGVAIAFIAGVVAIISPCSLPLVPAYIGHLAGVSAEAHGVQSRGLALRHSLAFVAGFTAVFVVLGASVGAVGYAVRDNLPTIQKVAGVLLILMGLNLARIINIPWLARTYEVNWPRQGGRREARASAGAEGATIDTVRREVRN